MPILGIMASQISGHLTAPSSFYSIATVTLSSASNSVTMSSIPSGYKSLQVRMIGQRPTSVDTWSIRLNGDTGANYAAHNLYGDGTVNASGYANQTYGLYVFGVGSGTNSTWGAAVIDIIDYASTTKNKTIRAFSGTDQNGTGGYVGLDSGVWLNTAAVTSITFANTNFNTGSTFALYGVL